jgi:hypothetical protein
MIISREYAIAPITLLSNRTKDTIKVGKGTLTKVTFYSAPGVNGEVYARVLHFENSIVPNETNEWIELQGTVQSFNLSFDDWHDIYNIDVEICAPQARFIHKINLELEISEHSTVVQLLTEFIKMGFRWHNQ